VKEQQMKSGYSMGLNFNNGECEDMLEIGVVDPALVKTHAIKIAGEVSEAILRIHTVLRRRNNLQEEF
jgi:chaperonin GroEL (HSP60 family)